MGARKWHVSRANHNKEVADFLAKNSHHDWAAVALFYAALHWVHSSLADEATLPRDERHPRKHTSPPGVDGRGVNQLVRDLYPGIHDEYISLFDMSRRTRYDYDELSKSLSSEAVWQLLLGQYQSVRKHCNSLNGTRTTISTQDR